MPNTKSPTRKRVAKKQVLSQVAKTIKAKSRKSPSRKAPTRKTKRASPSNKTLSYTRGKQLLSIAYNGAGNEFVFQVTQSNGRKGTEYHVAGSHIMNTMGIPIMVTPFT